jgi:serine/threonine protein kinase
MTSPASARPDAADSQDAEGRIAEFALLRCLADRDGIKSYLAERRGQFGFAKRVLLKIADRPFDDGFDVSIRLTDEARLAMRLSHPNLLSTLDLGREGARLYLVREWVDGIGLRGLLSRSWAAGASLPLVAALRVTIEVCRGLAYLHDSRHVPWASEGVVHRAVTPSNILLSRAGEIRLANLFMARPTGLSEGGLEAGARAEVIPAWRAPEVAAGRPADPRSDQFSLGLILLEAVVGPAALAGPPDSDWNRTRDDALIQSHLASESMPADLRPILARAIAPRVDERFATIDGFKDALRHVLRDLHRTDGDQELRDAVAAALA